MSHLSMTTAEEKSIDSKVEQMMDWAQTRQIEAEQLALDSARLMACTTDRLDRLSKQGFYKRCWSRFNGEANAMERANVNDVIQMQKMAFRYVNMLQEQQLLMAHSLLSLKNNLNSLAVREEETRNLIAMLAQRTLERFEQLEGRVGKLETSSNLHDWLFTLEERDYEEKIPTDYMRLLRIINDFYEIKNDNWNNNDLMFMRKAIRTVGLNPKEKISINAFIDKLADEIQSSEVGFETYDKAITLFAPDGMSNYSQFALENVSSPVFATLHGLNTQYRDKTDTVEALQESLSISTSDALKTLLLQSIKGMNVNLDYEFPLAETAIEILGCIRLTNRIYNTQNENNPGNDPVYHSVQISPANDSVPTNHNVQNSSSLKENNTHAHTEFEEIVNKIGNCYEQIGMIEEKLDNIFDSADKIYKDSENRSQLGIFGKALGLLNKNDELSKKSEITSRIWNCRKEIFSRYEKSSYYFQEAYKILSKNGIRPVKVDTTALESEPIINIEMDSFDWLYTQVDTAIDDSKLSPKILSFLAQCSELLVKLKKQEEVRSAEENSDMNTSEEGTPAHVIDGVRALDRFIDVTRNISESENSLDRNSTLFNTPKGVVGSLPCNYAKIIDILECKIAPESIVYFLSDGNKGIFATSDEDGDLAYLGSFDFVNNIYSIFNVKYIENIADTQDEERIIKKYGDSPEAILGESMQKFQEKALQTFPELAEMFD